MAAVERVTILGSAISVLASYEQAYQVLRDYLRTDGSPAYITVNNVHTVIEGVWHTDYRRITNGALLALPDGRPLSLVARWRGVSGIQRIFGPTFFERVLDWGQEEGLRHFLFGSSPDVLEAMRQEIARRFPRARIVGHISPPFRPLTAEENRDYLDRINRSGADIVWVALGAPRQERWMRAHYQQLERGVMIGIGAGFDYLAGRTRHAPEWMKRMALEWFYRLLQEPGRLWKRYLITNTSFLVLILLESLGWKRFES